MDKVEWCTYWCVTSRLNLPYFWRWYHGDIFDLLFSHVNFFFHVRSFLSIILCLLFLDPFSRHMILKCILHPISTKRITWTNGDASQKILYVIFCQIQGTNLLFEWWFMKVVSLLQISLCFSSIWLYKSKGAVHSKNIWQWCWHWVILYLFY